jgi:hypothetical protein
MPELKECPLCGGTMQLRHRTIVTQVPGNPKPTERLEQEWVCADCDYFEDADEER